MVPFGSEEEEALIWYQGSDERFALFYHEDIGGFTLGPYLETYC